jgi:hypothetical protein
MSHNTDPEPPADDNVVHLPALAVPLSKDGKPLSMTPNCGPQAGCP